MRFPLDGDIEIPCRPHPGAFGVRRKHDVHTGVDLYAVEGARVYALEPGVVVAVEDFTGPKAGSSWWLDTQAVLIEGQSGVICYGEITTALRVGDHVNEGQTVGACQRVLRHDKGLPTCMLHFELYEKGTTRSVVWQLDAPLPAELLDPTDLLTKAKFSPQAREKIERRHGHDFDYLPACLLCNPPHKESEASGMYITAGCMLLVMIIFGLTNLAFGPEAWTWSALSMGLQLGLAAALGLLLIMIVLKTAIFLLIVATYGVMETIVHTSKFMKYMYLRLKYHADE